MKHLAALGVVLAALFALLAANILITPEGELEEILQKKEARLAKASDSPTVKARHLLAKANLDEPKSVAAAMKKVHEALNRLKDGDDFAEVAQEMSEDEGTAPSGGALGWVAKGQMVKPFEEALFKLQPGEISGIVQTQYGFHIIKVEARREPKKKPEPDGKTP